MASLRAVREIHVQHTSEGADKVKRELDQQAAANDRLAQSSDTVAKATETSSRRQQSALGAYERHRASIDATFRATQQYERGLRTVERALDQGIIGTQEYARDLEQLRARQLAATTANDNMARATARNAAELSNLRAAFDPVYAAARRMSEEVDNLARLEREGIQIHGGYGAALDRIIAKYDETGQAARRAAEENAAFIQSARDAQAAENARQVAASNQDRFNSVLGVRQPAIGAARSSASVFEDDAAALGRLKAQLDPVGDMQARLATEVERYERWARQGQITTDDLAKATADGRRKIDEFRESLDRGNASAGGLFESLRGFAARVNPLLATIGASLSVGAVVAYADSWSDMQSRVGAAVRNMEAAPLLMERLVEIANASYSPLSQTVEVFSRNVTVMRDMGRSAMDAADFTESLNNALVITATRGQNAASVQDALSRAMATGRLQADGLEAVLANGGAVAEALAAELGTNVNGLRAFASAGKITGDVIADALIKRLVEMQERAAEMPATVGDAFVRVGTNLSAYIGQLDQGIGASSRFASMLLTVADNIEPIGRGAVVAGVAVTSAFAPAILAGIATGFTAIGTAVVAAMTAIGTAAALNPIGALAAALVTVTTALYLFRDEITSVLGVDLIDVARRTANEFIGLFVAAYEGVEEAWGRLPNFMSGIGKQAWNSLIEEFENPALTITLPGLGEKVLIPGLDLSALKNDLNTVETLAVDKVFSRVSDAVGRDYLGAMAEAAGWTRTVEDAVGDLNSILGETPGAARGAGEVLSDAQKKAAASFAAQIRSLEQNTEGLQRQISALDLTAGATAAAELRARELARAWDIAREAGMDAIPETTKTAIDDAAASVENLTDQLERLNLDRGQENAMRMLEAEARLVGMSADARRVAMAGLEAEQRLRSQNIVTTDEWGQAYIRNAQSAAGMRVEIDRQTKAFETQDQFVRNVLSEGIDGLFDIGKAESWGDAVMGVFKGIFDQFQELAKQNLMQAIFGQNYTTGQLAPGQRSIAQPGFPTGFGGAPVAANQNTPVGGGAINVRAVTALNDNLQRSSQSALDVARQFDGLNERADSAVLDSFMQASGNWKNLSAADTAWCAAFANAAIMSAGGRGTNSNLASSFMDWGQGTNNPQVGDIVVLKPQARGASGHVGFVAGFGDGTVQVFGGNQSNAANTRSFGLDQVRGYRTGVGVGGAGVGGSFAMPQIPAYAAPQMSSAAHQAMAGGWSGFGPVPGQTGRSTVGIFGQNGRISQIMQSPIGQLGMMGLGAFGSGYSSGSAGSGALSGGLTGLMTAGPVGGLVGLVGGALGGLFGGRQRRKQEHQARAQEWAAQSQEWAAYQEEVRTGTGPTSGLRASQEAMANRLTGFVQTGSAAWKNGSNNSSELFASVSRELGEYFARTNAAFQQGFSATLDSLNRGLGMEGPFVQAQKDIVEAGKTLATFIDDTKVVFGEGSTEAQRAAEASIAQLRAMLGGGRELSEIETTILSMEGAAAALRSELEKLGASAEDASRAVGDDLSAAMGRLRADFTQSLQDQINDLDGRGYLADFRNLVEGVAATMQDATRIGGVDTSLVDTFFAKSAQNLVNQSELAGEAFDELVRTFPELSGVVKEFSQAVVTATEAEIRSAIEGYQDRLFAAQNAGNDLAAFERRAAQERTEAAKFGAEAVLAIEKTHAAERANIVLAGARADLDRAFQEHQEAANERIRALREEASELGRTVSRLTDFTTQLREFRESLMLDANLSTLAPDARLAEAERQFREIAARAAGGDEDAQRQLTGAGERYLTESRDFWGISERYYANFDEVRRVIEQQERAAQGQLTEAQRQLEAINRQITLEEEALALAQKQYDALLGIQTGVMSLGTAIAAFAAAEAAARAAGVNTGTGAAGGSGGSGEASFGRAVDYLNRNPDIAAGIAAGQTFGLPAGSSIQDIAKAHWERHGQYELGNPGRKAYANGGLILGPGSAMSDHVTMYGSAGEFMMRRAAVDKIGVPAMDWINQTGTLPSIQPPPVFMNDNRTVVAAIDTLTAQNADLSRQVAHLTAMLKGTHDEAQVIRKEQLKAAAKAARVAEEEAA